MSAAKHEPDTIEPMAVRDQLIRLRIARDRLRDARAEVHARSQRGKEWLTHGRNRTVEQASAYVGLAAAQDDVREAKSYLASVVDDLLGVVGTIEMDLARVARLKGGAS